MSPQRRNIPGGGPQSAADPLPGTATLGSPESRSAHPARREQTASQRGRTPQTPFSCGGCDATWTAPTACHCGGCHRTFGGLGSFDVHRSTPGEHGTCLDPATLARRGEPLMVLRDGVWRERLTDEDRARLEASWARQREAVSDA